MFNYKYLGFNNSGNTLTSGGTDGNQTAPTTILLKYFC
jgi:hypothetical protein